MEIKVNKEVRSYQESILLGLSMRQFICSILAVGVAVGLYFLTKDRLHKEVVSWICILSAVPIAMTGFIKYNGLTFEKFVIKWFQSEVLNPKQVVFKADNIYKHVMDAKITTKKKPKKEAISEVIAQSDITDLVYKVLMRRCKNGNHAKIRKKEISKILNIDTKRIKTALLELEDLQKIVPIKRGFYLLDERRNNID
jgi:hypothetical protein